MGASRGILQGGVGWREAVLAKAQGGIGDRCSIFLAQDATSENTWQIQIYAMTDDGSLRVGGMHTKQVGLAGELPSRLVATANVPGAIGWKISAHCADPLEKADVWIASNPGSGGEPGLVVIESGTQNPTATRTNIDLVTTQVTGAGVLPPRGSTLWSVRGVLTSAQIAGAATYVCLFDQPTAPAGGDVPIWAQHIGLAVVGAAPDPSEYYYTAPRGYAIKSALWLATSTDPDAYAADVAHLVTVNAVVSNPD